MQGVAADLLVGSTDNSIRRYDGTTGALKGYFVTPGAGGLNTPTNAIFGPDGNLYVGSLYTHSVKRYKGTTGAYIDDFVPPGSGGGISPYDLTFGPDGNLYVASGWDYSPGSGHVKRFNGTTGVYIDDFVPSGSGGLDYAQGLVFGPDGNLYVADNAASAILRYNGATGAFIDVFAPVSGDPTSLKFGSDGNLYVSLFYGHVIERYDGATGADMGPFVPTGSGGLYWDYDIAFGPDGNLYETERYSNSVKRFNGTTGAYINDFVTGIPGEVLYLTLTVDQAPAITSANYTTFIQGTPGSFTITATGFPVPALTYTPISTGLPSGVSFVDNHNRTATLSGTPTVSGVFSFWVIAKNIVKPPAQQSFSLTVLAPVTPIPTNLSFSSVKVGQSAKKLVALKNNSSNTVGIGPVTFSVTSGDKSQFSLGPVCPAMLTAGNSCTIGVVFTPDSGTYGRSYAQHRDQRSRQSDPSSDYGRGKVKSTTMRKMTCVSTVAN